MSKILCITSGLTGILNASFELASRIQKAGHECIIASPASVEQKVKEQNFSYLQLSPTNFDPAPALPEYKGAFRKVQRWLYKLINAKQRRLQAIESLGMEKFMEKIDSLKPDLILIDIELHEQIMTLQMSSYKFVLLSQWFSTWNRKGLPPIISDTIPGIGFNGSSLGMKLSWMKVRLKRWKVFLKKKITSVYTDRRSILQLYAKTISFPRKYIPDNYWPGPFSYDILPVWSMTSQCVDFPHDFRPNMQYLGPMVYTNRKDTSIDSSTSQKIQSIIDEKNESGKQLVYCSVSTFMKGDVSFLKKVIEAFKNQDGWLLIISLGGLMDNNEFDQLPSNVYAFNRVDQLKVLAKADLSINHGGIHTINECLHFNVPMLVYSGKKSDQDGCAARVQYHALGVMADKDVDTSDDIVSGIKKIFDDASVHEKVNDYNELNKKYKDNNILENLVNTFLTRK